MSKPSNPYPFDVHELALRIVNAAGGMDGQPPIQKPPHMTALDFLKFLPPEARRAPMVMAQAAEDYFYEVMAKERAR